MTQYCKTSTESTLSKRDFSSHSYPEKCLTPISWSEGGMTPLLGRSACPLVSWVNWNCLNIALLLNSNFLWLLYERCISSEQGFPLSHSTGQGFVVLIAQRKMAGSDSEVAAMERHWSEWSASPLWVKEAAHSSFAESSLNRWRRKSVVASEFVKW